MTRLEVFQKLSTDVQFYSYMTCIYEILMA